MDNQYRKNIIKNALLTNSRICLPEFKDDRIIESSKRLKKLGFNIINYNKLLQNTSTYRTIVKEKTSFNNDELICVYFSCGIINKVVT